MTTLALAQGSLRTIPVFYCNQQSVAHNPSFSPSAGKPEKVVKDWLDAGLPVDLRAFTPLTREEIACAHDPDFVADILEGRADNGFGNRSLTVAQSLPFTTGSMAAAARHAYAAREGVTVSPTSGFHHAGYDRNEGFCTFNGLMIAALMAIQDGAKRVGICDIDAHWGNGTDDIIARLGLQYCIPHYTFGLDSAAKTFLRAKDKIIATSEKWLERLPTILENMFAGVDLLLYQAGADPWINDPMGGFLTMDHMARRDHIVFNFCKRNDIPVAYNLAGGYAKPFTNVLDIHRNTFKTAANIYLGHEHSLDLGDD